MQDPCAQFSNDFVFLQAIQEGNEQAIECLYVRMYKICIPYALSRSTKKFTEDDAKDILHDTFCIVLAKLKSGDYSLTEVPIIQFARKIFWYQWVSFVRKKLKEDIEDSDFLDKNTGDGSDDTETDNEQLGLPDDNEFDIIGAVDGEIGAELEDKQWQAKTDCIQNALDRLSKDCRDFIIWFYIDGIPLAECAERASFTEGYAKVKRYRCTESFKIFYLACIGQ